jgi:hypothetical protein
VANKNSLRRREAARDAFGRIKHGHPTQVSDDLLSSNVGTKARLSKRPKVAAGGNKPRTPGLR